MTALLFLYKSYITQQGYTFTDQMSQRLLSDPDQGILPISNTLSYFRIPYAAANVPKTALQELPSTFIAQISNGQVEKLVLVSKQANNTLTLQMQGKTNRQLNVTEFLNEWTGFVLLIETNSNALINIKQLMLKSILIMGLLFAIIHLFLRSHSVLSTIYLGLCFVGLGLSYSIVKEYSNAGNSLSKFCEFSQKTSCIAVLKSEASKLFGGIDLSDASVIYFCVITAMCIYQPNTVFLFYASLLALPMVVYSLYQQHVNIQKWCPLCLAIASVLVLQWLTLLFAYGGLTLEYGMVLQFVSAISVIAVIWVHIKPLIALKGENNRLATENLTFRRNYNLFLPYYNSLDKLPTASSKLQGISLGAKNPIVRITAISNPLCSSCIAIHNTYMNLIQQYPETLQINFRFLIPFANRTAASTQIAERLLELYFETDTTQFTNAFADWYSNPKASRWLNQWGQCKSTQYHSILQQQATWCLKHNIQGSPRVLVNDKLFPDSYHAQDIEHFIAPLIALENTENKHIKPIHA